jgi:hypothetical protein
MDGFSPEEECWEYMDPKGTKQGSFSSSRMGAWYEHKMLPDDLKVRCSPHMQFLPIRKLFPAPQVPFSYRPQVSPPASFDWQYRDTKGLLQGPFSTTQMSLWYDHNMLPKDLALKRTIDAAYATIGEYFPHPLQPFKSSPVTPSDSNGFSASRGVATAGSISAVGTSQSISNQTGSNEKLQPKKGKAKVAAASPSEPSDAGDADEKGVKGGKKRSGPDWRGTGFQGSA